MLRVRVVVPQPLEANPAFDALARRFGVDGSGHEHLSGRIEGQRVTAQLQRNPDSERQAHGVSLTVYFEGKPRLGDDGPSLLLRGEDATDVRDKARGLVREVQLGFPGFDRQVFIDNTCSEAEARRLLSKESTREAARRILDLDGSSILITPTSATFSMPLRATTPAAVLSTALDELLTVARVGGPRDTARSQQRGTALPAVSVITLGLTVPYAWWVQTTWPASVGVASVAGVLAGVAALFARPAIEDACAGDSASASRARAVLTGFVLSAFAFTFGVLVHLNGALDDSPGVLWRGVVTSVSTPTRSSRSSGLTRLVHVRWRDGSKDTRVWDAQKPGDEYLERRFRGALGFEWVGRGRGEVRAPATKGLREFQER